MSYFLQIIKSALEDFKRNKIRTALTSLGIMIGVFSVVILVALGLGLKKYIQQQFDTLGTNMLYIMPGKVIEGGNLNAGSAMSQAKFDDKDVNSLKQIESAPLVVPFYINYLRIQFGGKSKTVEVDGSNTDLFPVLNLGIEYGSKFTKSDVATGAKKIVMGPKVAKYFFDTEENAIGKTVVVAGQGYKVIGVAKAKGGGGLGPSIDDQLYMPYKAVAGFLDIKKYYAIYIKGQTQDDVVRIKQEAKKILLKRYKDDDFSVIEQTEFLGAINSIFNILNSILVAIAAISLLVGGIGIMNIMYVSVTERIKEIGIRRAIGARGYDILYQFLAESVILSVFGGLLGLILAYLVTLLLKSIFPAYISIDSVLLALLVSSGIGILFGVFPAKKAADLSPIDAIRYE